MSNLLTEFDVDDPLVLDASYKIGTIADRRKIDDQVQDIQRVLVDGHVNGHLDSYYLLSQSSVALAPGDAFCISQSDPNGTAVTKATASPIALAGAVIGIAATAANPGTKFRGILRGIVPASIYDLGVGATNQVGVDGSTARLVRVPAPDDGDILVGFCDTNGIITFTGSAAGIGGGGGGGIDPIGVPDDGYIIAWSASTGQWVVTPRSPFSIQAFAAVTPLVEAGSTVTTPAFTATLSTSLSAGDTAVLTNTLDAEAKDVHTTPTSFSSGHTHTLATPGAVWGFTLSILKAGNALQTRTTNITGAQRNYIGGVAPSASLATLIAAATSNALNTTGLFTFSITDTGSLQWQISRPTRLGVPVIHDQATGFQVGLTYLRTTLFTNPSGFQENYDQYTFDAPINGTLNGSVVA